MYDVYVHTCMYFPTIQSPFEFDDLFHHVCLIFNLLFILVPVTRYPLVHTCISTNMFTCPHSYCSGTPIQSPSTPCLIYLPLFDISPAPNSHNWCARVPLHRTPNLEWPPPHTPTPTVPPPVPINNWDRTNGLYIESGISWVFLYTQSPKVILEIFWSVLKKLLQVGK